MNKPYSLLSTTTSSLFTLYHKLDPQTKIILEKVTDAGLITQFYTT